MPRTLPFFREWKESRTVGAALKDGLTSYQLVGRVTAYQGNDG